MSNADEREEIIFDAALRLPSEQRAAYLDQTCAGNADLRRRVQIMLNAFERAGGFLNEPAILSPERTLAFPPAPTEKPGERIGLYKLLQQIGEGGCGVVYMAEQSEPVRRRVALKVIKLGMDTKCVIARFEAERQALALMDHPNIAKVLEAGATEAGRPYFVMELVRGIKITDYCDENKLSTQNRLKLFIQICQAIQHAHQKGIIHRDIKPSNILVADHDGVPVPKVIDFGIAKATTDQRLTDKTLFTALEQFIGTPAYMSPEQAKLSGLDIDTRTDIYSLGVLLYELLTGKTPFDANALLQSGLDEMRRTIREIEPPKPSTRLSTMLDAERTVTATHRHTDPPRLIHLVCGDLDWIVMKSLEKDRARRYESANGLAADIQRHLTNEPIIARPPSNLYRLQKAIRRNKTAFATAAAVTVLLAVGLLVSTWQAVRATRAERIQNQLRQQAEAQMLRARGCVDAGDGRWDEAAADYFKAREIDPAQLKLSFDFAIVLLKTGRTEEYRSLCHRYLEHVNDDPDFVSADMAAKVSLLLPVDGADFTRACELADFAATESDSSWHFAFVRLGKSLADYRRGRWDSANDWVNRTIGANVVTPRHKAGAYFIQASVCARMGQFELARMAFSKGDELIKSPNNVPSDIFGDTWCDMTIAELLRREAKGLLESQPALVNENTNRPDSAK